MSRVRQKQVHLWKSFWRSQIPLAVRTPWYCLLQGKSPCAQILYKHVKDLCDPICHVCAPQSIAEHVDHFFFLCPKKRFVWEQVWPHFFGYPMSTHLVYRAIDLLHLPLQCLSLLSNESMIGCTLLCIWKAHWRFIFDGIPFDPLLVFKTFCHRLVLLSPAP
ncbi:hypothetical protein RO3G_10740 [Rhizopus delemar RA 99-880]|uniref:Reverse transcriptase zinc-binding domain-containing protein n=1 Tax=Rhizopus delemar (strain RA 99-880 / ATCC MYA-4621 / FGSC 9543 / NRRL 43880) TaxID=246409 RepID=I1CC49_RHIO9|nr:hypothetical protein RO3G_10740 [Rhizopus delemar RA 99-880]|eukprot:EIE86029.1 hypothetical protein RO3G_10740 [Rhizopus delemar RA 99-880]